jgi:hypothetical protein
MFFGLNDVAFLGGLGGGSAYDADAQDYINRVIAADVAAGNNSGLEAGVQDAYNAFFVACKSDGMLNAIKACCIMAGAQTLEGCLVPLVGTAPTNFNFVSGDYNRKTGLAGNGSTKYLNSNRNNNADPQNSKHISTYATNVTNQTIATYMGATQFQNVGASVMIYALDTSGLLCRVNHAANTAIAGQQTTTGFKGLSRDSSANVIARMANGNTTLTETSQTPAPFNIAIFGRNNANTFDTFLNARLAFYSIGESLDLALLDARVTALINAFDAAI